MAVFVIVFNSFILLFIKDSIEFKCSNNWSIDLKVPLAYSKTLVAFGEYVLIALNNSVQLIELVPIG